MGTTRTGGVEPTHLLRPISQATYEKVFGTVYVGLMVNVLVTVACSPLLAALAMVRNPIGSWPFFLALSCLCAPAVGGAFGCFSSLGQGGTSVLRTFWAAYRKAARRALPAWAAAAVILGVLVVDALVVMPTSWGGALVPFFVTASALVLAVVFGLVVLAVERPQARLREVVGPCLYLITRRWYLAVVNVAVLGLMVTVVLVKPVAGVLVACSPLLYVVWANTRYALAPMSRESDHTGNRL